MADTKPLHGSWLSAEDIAHLETATARMTEPESLRESLRHHGEMTPAQAYACFINLQPETFRSLHPEGIVPAYERHFVLFLNIMLEACWRKMVGLSTVPETDEELAELAARLKAVSLKAEMVA